MAADVGSRALRALERVRSAALAPTLVGLVVAVAATYTWPAWHRPVLEHDDWDMLLPNGVAFVQDHAQRVLHEGRWLNYWWWRLGSRHVTPHAAVLGFSLGWLTVTATLTRVLTRTWWGVPIAVALYSSPMAGQISFWPATILLPMAVLAASSVALALTRHRWALHLGLLTATTFIQMLAYPAFALMIVPLLLALHAHASWKRLLWLAVAFAGAYVGGILVMFGLNAARFGVFGLTISAWRRPTPLTGPGALVDHLGVVWRNNHALVETIGLPLLAVGVCLVLAVLSGERRRLVVLALAFLLTLGLSSASTLLNGVDVPFRSAGWVWSFGVIAIVWALESRPLGVRLVAGLALVAVALWSAAYWVELNRAHQRFAGAMDRIRDQVVEMYDAGHERIVFIPRVSYQTNVADLQAAWRLGNALAKEDGILVAGRCASCEGRVAYADAHAPGRAVLLRDGTVLVRFPASVLRAPLDAQPMPRWLTPFT